MTSSLSFPFAAHLLLALALFGVGEGSDTEAFSAPSPPDAQAKSVRGPNRPHRATLATSRSAKARSTKARNPSGKKSGKSRAGGKHGKSPSAAATTRGGQRHHAPITAYRFGHGNGGIGAITPPAAYTAPAPAIAVDPANMPASGLPGEIESAVHLDRFFARLQAVESGDNQQIVRILQFGDSHTAADMFTGRMRSLLQQKFGNGGAGFTYPGHPFAGYRILGTSRGQSGGWIEEGVHFTKIINTALGLGGVASTTMSPGDSMSLDAPCSMLQVHYLEQPGGGTFSVSEDGRVLSRISTDNPLGPQTYEAPCTANSGDRLVHHFDFVADSSHPIRIFGTVTERPGITYEALGLNGAEAALMLRWNQTIFSSYLKQRDPALIVLAYGTNEAGNHNWTYETYSALMGRLVDTLHATAPEAAILVIGPPDRSLRTGRRRSAQWKTFAGTVPISDAQRDVCRTHSCAFWDWRARMGGLGSMNRWVSDGLAQPDHTHFTSAGYIQLADLFYSDIIAAYGAWKGPHRDSPIVIRSSLPQP